MMNDGMGNGGAVMVGARPVTGGGGDAAGPRLNGAAFYEIAALFFASRLLILTAAALSRKVVIRSVFEGGRAGLLDVFLRWDSNWYLIIATEGYAYDPNAQSAVGFYPLLPLLIRGLVGLGMDPVVAGYAISNAALLGACVLLWRLTALETGSVNAARGAVLFLLFCPGSVWFSMIYTESLSLFTTLACLLAARRRRWLLAGVAGYAAALTRTTGLFAAGFLFLEAAQQLGEARREAALLARPGGPGPGWGRVLASRWTMLAGIAGPVLGHATFLTFLQLRFGDWRAQQKTFAAGWHVQPFQLPWVKLPENWESMDPFFRGLSFPMIGVMLVLGGLSFFALRRWGYPALLFALVLLFVSSTNLRDFTRYSMTVAPIFPTLGWLVDRVPVLKAPLLAFSIMLLTLLTVLLVNGYHIN